MATAKKGKKFVFTVKATMDREMTRSEAREIMGDMLGTALICARAGEEVTKVGVSRDVQIE